MQKKAVLYNPDNPNNNPNTPQAPNTLNLESLRELFGTFRAIPSGFWQGLTGNKSYEEWMQKRFPQKSNSNWLQRVYR